MNRLLPILAAVVVVGGGVFWYLNQPGSSSTPLETAASEASDADLSLVQEMSLGNPDAPVTIIEYASYTCPHCRNFHAGPFKDLKADYIDTGKVHFIYREVFFQGDLPALWAGMTARCAGPDRFFAVVDEIYRQQETWSRLPNAQQSAAAIRRVGQLAGLSEDELEACLSDADKAQAMVAVDVNNRNEHGIRSTPSFVINGTTYSNMDYAEFSRLIDAEIGS